MLVTSTFFLEFPGLQSLGCWMLGSTLEQYNEHWSASILPLILQISEFLYCQDIGIHFFM